MTFGNIALKGEIAQNEQFHLELQYFPTLCQKVTFSFPDCSTRSSVDCKVDNIYHVKKWVHPFPTYNKSAADNLEKLLGRKNMEIVYTLKNNYY